MLLNRICEMRNNSITRPAIHWRYFMMELCLVLLAHLQLFSVLFQQLQDVWINKSQDGTRYLYDYIYIC